jgi:SAM-dependent methyltransferase
MTTPICPLCGAASADLVSLPDHFFGSPGTWSYRRCDAATCGVVFPFPAPTDAELERAYSTYYTHEDSGGTSLPGWVEARLAGAVASSSRSIRRLPAIGWLAEQIAWELGGLTPRDGLIVDIGAGDGARLDRLRRAGWTRVAGVEPDPEAVRVAKIASIDVRHGSAEAVPMADNSADAALMHHVIEHVRDPRQAFAEAYRILKPGGELSIVTPNIDSLGRTRWGEFWRGYEAPRHLTIFTLAALDMLGRDTGFDIVCSRSSARSAAWVDEVSEQAAGSTSTPLGRVARLRRADHAFRAQAKAGSGERGEEIVFVARKPRA